MIVKNPDYKYKVSYVSQGGKDDKAWTRFSIADYDKKQKKNFYITVLLFEHMELNDGDKVSFEDYQVGVNEYRGKQQTTLFVSKGHVNIVEMGAGEEVVATNTTDLPW